MTGWRSLADAADMVGAVLDVVGQNVAVAIHPAAHGFEAGAGDYERARPDYPAEAGRWLAERLDLRPGQGRGYGGRNRQTDASAGGHGATVVAVEPVAGHARAGWRRRCLTWNCSTAWRRRSRCPTVRLTPRRSDRRFTGSTAIGL